MSEPFEVPVAQATSKLPLISLITAIVAFVLAVIPGFMMLGWILLVVGLVLSIVTLALKHQPRTLTFIALGLSIAGIILAPIVFRVVVAYSVQKALDDASQSLSSHTSVTAPADSSAQSAAGGNMDTPAPAPEAPTEEAGIASTRDSPVPLGSEIKSGEWSVVVNSVDLHAAEKIQAANEFNEPPAEGEGYVLVNMTATYLHG